MSVMSRSSAPSPIVIDASALVELLLQSATGKRVAATVNTTELIAPDLANPEVMQSLRGLERSGQITAARAARALRRLIESDIARIPTRVLLQEAWKLRSNLSAYDACYVALARMLHCPLLTTDRPLTRAPGLAVTLICV
jgi:predicted nucleic acid-binding protein